MNYTNRIKPLRKDEKGEEIMRDVLFRYENNSTHTEGIYFDMEKDGIREKMGWIQSTDALLALDKNHDGVIDKNDSAYNALSAWIDTNQDGITDNGELHSLSELGVTSISLNATETTTYEDQNAISHSSSFTQQTTDAEGNTITETKTVNDVWFKFKIQRKVA